MVPDYKNNKAVVSPAFSLPPKERRTTRMHRRNFLKAGMALSAGLVVPGAASAVTLGAELLQSLHQHEPETTRFGVFLRHDHHH
ncbi:MULTISPECIES: twin-arginine translocation signal domain-containing protein [unclassified Thioalkalivibrio]|uniref:twin-arginine translocation signal domain-containing protein n=1 Tax=unclassified Thioalkalivibrio TaxID=2621013 RepID=UPI00038114D0|nr:MULTISPECIES: twin-arginine translocation signal domain-containing protein [unclassified Thioalkalivibrio]